MQGQGIRLTWSQIGHGLLFFLLVFQDALTDKVSIIRYFDEVIAIVGIALIAFQSLSRGILRFQKSTGWMVFCCVIFVVVGFFGNLIYQYQQWSAVMEDALINVKFFLAIITGFVLFDGLSQREMSNRFGRGAQIVTVLLFGAFLADVVFGIFSDAGYRYGIRAVKLFYRHSTFLAATTVFLITTLTMFPRKGNGWLIAMNLIMLVFTLRAKAIAAAACYVFVYILAIAWKKKLNFWYFMLIGCMAITLAWEQIYYYFAEVNGARSVLLQASFKIFRDYFPIGTGFGTFASNVAGEHYSPVYYLYGISNIWGMTADDTRFISDSFWPIIFGQTGLVGTVCFVGLLGILAAQIFKIRKIDRHIYAAGIFALGYLLISSTAEAAFHNAVSIPLAVLLGMMFALRKQNCVEQRRLADAQLKEKDA